MSTWWISPKFIFSAVFILVVLIFGFYFFLEPFAQPERIILSNISDRQVTVSWVTKKPTKGTVIVAKKGEGFTSFFSKERKMVKDNRDKRLRISYLYTAHSITPTNLEPKTTYQYRIYEGWRKVYEGTFTTGTPLLSIVSPKPVYGAVVMSDKKTPTVGVLVYLRAVSISKTGTITSNILSTVTNARGKWSLDLANMKTQDGKKPMPLSSNLVEQVLIDGGSIKTSKASVTFGKDQPWPVIIVK